MGVGLARWAWALSSLGLLATGVSASAQQKNIGAAAETHSEVSREIAGAPGKLVSGDPVYRDEVVRTGAASLAKLVFLDSTNLAVGPISRVVLDRFVYADAASKDSIAIRLSKGVFRFTTGTLDKHAYSILTPIAAIGVRGTILDIESQPARTRVTLVEGRAIVCPLGKGSISAPSRKCVTVDTPGQTVEVDLVGGANHAGLTPAKVDFGRFCSGSLCSQTRYASIADQVRLASAPVTPASGSGRNDDLSPAGPAADLGGAALCGR